MKRELKDIPQPLLLTIPEAALLLNISRAKLYDMIDKGEGPPVIHLGRAVRIYYDSLCKWIEELEREQQQV